MLVICIKMECDLFIRFKNPITYAIALLNAVYQPPILQHNYESRIVSKGLHQCTLLQSPRQHSYFGLLQHFGTFGMFTILNVCFDLIGTLLMSALCLTLRLVYTSDGLVVTLLCKRLHE